MRAPKSNPVGALLDAWQTTRAELRALEVAAHQDITDALGRVWVWKDGDLYVHDSMAWPRSLVERPNVGWPAHRLLDNPNYRWCEVCLREMTAAQQVGASS
jgi:hypothetical protein